MTDFLAPMATVTIPPAITSAAQALAVEDVHPAWRKLRQKGRYCIVATNELDDITELADWAQCSLKEPHRRLTKAERQAFQTLVERASRWAVIEPLGPLHCWARSWKVPPHKKK